MPRFSLKTKVAVGLLLILAIAYGLVKLDNLYHKNQAELPPLPEAAP